MTSKDLLASASETPAPRGLASLVRAEWFFLVSAASVAAFALFEDRLFSRLDNPLILTAILLWLFGVVLWSSLSVVRHAESLARRLGEPYGTLLLTLAITSIEVVAISAVVRHGGPNPTLMRDTLLAVIMIIMNGMVGVTLLDRRRQASRADVQSAGRQRLSQRPPAARDLRPHHAGLHADDPGPNLFGRRSNSSW